MYITAREKEIISLLLAHPDGISVAKIAKAIGLSQRTIQRELKSVATILAQHQLGLKKLSGAGLLLQGEASLKQALKANLQAHTADFTAKEREALISLSLLDSADVTKLIALATDFNVTVGTISADLTAISKDFQTFGISLIRKKGYGITLVASEQQKRNALCYLLAMQFNEYEFFEILKNPTESENRFLDAGQIARLTLAAKIVSQIITGHGVQLTDHAQMTLTIYLFIATERITKDELISMDSQLLTKLQADEKYLIATEIATKLSEAFNLNLPQAELAYLTVHLKGARLNGVNCYNSAYVPACTALIGDVSRQLAVPFENDLAVLEGLLKHIDPAIYRLECGLNLYNPLTAKIATEYPQLFEAVKTALTRCFSHLRFSADEIAYIVLYFGASQLLYSDQEELKIAVICPSGLGSSKMIAHRLTKELKAVNNVTTFALGDLKFATIGAFDLVLSTIEITNYPGDYLLVSPLLTDAELEKIQQTLKPYTKTTEAELLNRSRQIQKQAQLPFDIKQEFHKIQIYSELVLKLLATFNLHNLRETDNLDKIVDEMLLVMHTNKLITDVAGVKADLWQRQQLGGFGIPNTQIAFYHCRTAKLKTPVFTAFRLKKPIRLNAMDNQPIDASSILMLLAPHDLGAIELEVLSQISSTITGDQATIALFTSGSKAAITATLNKAFYQKFKTILK